MNKIVKNIAGIATVGGLLVVLYSLVNKFALNFQTSADTDFVKPNGVYKGGDWSTVSPTNE